MTSQMSGNKPRSNISNLWENRCWKYGKSMNHNEIMSKQWCFWETFWKYDKSDELQLTNVKTVVIDETEHYKDEYCYLSDSFSVNYYLLP